MLRYETLEEAEMYMGSTCKLSDNELNRAVATVLGLPIDRDWTGSAHASEDILAWRDAAPPHVQARFKDTLDVIWSLSRVPYPTALCRTLVTVAEWERQGALLG